MTHLPALTSNRLRPRQTHSHLLTFRGFAAADSSATYSIIVLRGRSASKGYLPTLPPPLVLCDETKLALLRASGPRWRPKPAKAPGPVACIKLATKRPRGRMRVS